MDKKILIILGVVIYGLSTFASYSFFNAQASSNKLAYEAPVGEDGSEQDGAPKTEQCPLNGQLYSEEQRKKWESRRPLGIMVQNNVEARPQSGLSGADVVHEAVAEGGITRFLAMYYCESPTVVGSVRSARVYYVELLQGFGEYPLYAHVGGANKSGPADALGKIRKLKWWNYNDLDNLGSVGFPQMWRDYDRLPDRDTEHTVYTNPEKLWSYAAQKRELTNVDEDGVEWTEDFEPWEFQGDATAEEQGTVKKINFGFWDNSLASDYLVEWNYDAATNRYLRVNGGEKHIDFNTDKQLSAKNVIVVFADERPANDGYEHGQHLLYDVVGSDDAIIFQNGQAIEGSWEKDDEEDMMRFYDDDGEEIKLVAGKIWIEILPSGNDVDY